MRRMSLRAKVLLPLTALFVLTTALQWAAHAQQRQGAAAAPASNNYTGQTSRVDNEGALLGRRRFEAGARSAWHIHPKGQLIFIEEGRGRVQRKGEAIKELSAGQSDFTGPGIPHWHGAAPDQAGVQSSISYGGIGPWLEPVTDDEYLGRAAAKK